MDQAMPTPDAEKKAADLALARKNFEALQGSRDPVRPTSDRPKGGFIRGVKSMFAHISTRGALSATTALVALGLVIALPQMQDLRGVLSGGGDATIVTESTSGTSDEDSIPVAAKSRETTQEAPAPVPMADAMVPGAEIAPAPQSTAPAGGAVNSVQGLSRRAAPTNAPFAQIAPADRMAPRLEANTEAFANADKNPLRITAEEPVSTFSIDVDTASYSVIRSSLRRGQLPPSEAVRIEEMVNYFPYDYAAPAPGEAPFKPTVTLMPTPWNQGTELVHIAIQGRAPALTDRPPLNLVFLIDTSGSMNSPDKLPLLKQSLALMLPRLSAEDQVAIVAYAGSAGEVLAPTSASERASILGALDRLAAGGGTAGQAGLQQAYAVAEGMAGEGEVTRVILATDGDFNVGLSDPEQLKEYIAAKRENGTYLSVMGFGRGNLDDATMQALAQNGNGQAAYIDTLSEAQKVLVDQFSGALFPIADDVKMQVEFNPATVAEYRLIGYETRALKREDFNNDKVDAGDIGAGTSVTAIYEITPAGSPARLTDPLRYGEGAAAAQGDELGYLKLRYKEPGAKVSQLIEMPITPGMGVAGDDARFAIAIASFGGLLKQSKYLQDWSFDDALALANGAKGEDAFGYRAEAVQLMRLAESLQR
ncbi:YfbK domain-containing protein [Rhodalgimonas zhirmunskyi]